MISLLVLVLKFFSQKMGAADEKRPAKVHFLTKFIFFFSLCLDTLFRTIWNYDLSSNGKKVFWTLVWPTPTNINIDIAVIFKNPKSSL